MVTGWSSFLQFYSFLFHIFQYHASIFGSGAWGLLVILVMNILTPFLKPFFWAFNMPSSLKLQNSEMVSVGLTPA